MSSTTNGLNGARAQKARWIALKLSLVIRELYPSPLAAPIWPATIPCMNTLCITGGRIIDPSQGIDQIGELWIRGENILGIGPQPQLKADQTIDAAGLIVCPG